MATTIDIATRASIAKLLRMLGTDRDGELVATVYALRRVLANNKLDLHDLARIVVETPSVAPTNGDGRTPHWRQRDDHPVETELPWRDMVAACVRHLSRFTGKERDFIRHMDDWHGTPSAKQLGWLVACFERVRGMK
jgi:hypothetical protein